MAPAGAGPPVSNRKRHLVFEMGPYRVTVATAFGPRLTGLRRDRGPELFVQLGDDAAIERADSGIYRFHGGHRLWAAPEVPRITYASEDHPCDVGGGDDGVTVRGPVDSAGLQKTIHVAVNGDTLVVDHFLDNAGAELVEIAPWAITQLRLGGVALLPTASRTPHGLQADRSLVLWPYTSLTDPRLSWHDGTALLQALPGPRFKLGTGPTPGRLGYLIDGQLFTKAITAAGPGSYPDRGAVGQLFVEDAFCELESAGPLALVQPGQSVSHREVWTVTDCPNLATAESLVAGEEWG